MTDALKSFDRVAHLYDETRGVPPDVEARIGDGIAALAKEVAPQPHLLEVGIGTGRIAVPLSLRGVRVTGVDTSTKMLAILRAKSAPIDTLIAEASRLPLRASSLDAALFVHILHLVPDPEATVRAAVEVVRPGGVLIEAADEREDSPRSRADDLIRSTVQELSGVDLGGWTPYDRATETFARVLAGTGAELHSRTLARWKASTTARRMIERLKRRDYSSSWKIPDDIMPGLIETVAPRVEELFGGLDTPVEYDRAFSMRFARLPA